MNMDRSTAQVVSIISIFVYVFAAIILAFCQQHTVLVIVTVVWLALYLYLCHCMRCPNCGKWPGRGELFAQYCSRCGEPLD